MSCGRQQGRARGLEPKGGTIRRPGQPPTIQLGPGDEWWTIKSNQSAPSDTALEPAAYRKRPHSTTSGFSEAGALISENDATSGRHIGFRNELLTGLAYRAQVLRFLGLFRLKLLTVKFLSWGAFCSTWSSPEPRPTPSALVDCADELMLLPAVVAEAATGIEPVVRTAGATLSPKR